MSKFYGYFYSELCHWFGVSAVQRLEKRIGSRALMSLENSLVSYLQEQFEKDWALKMALDVHEPKKY